MNVLELIQSTTDYFERNGVESPRLNIEHLLAGTLECKRMDLYMQFDRPLGEKELTPLRELVKRRAKGEPLQHLLGSSEFFGREFICDTRGLIPRPETEQLVEAVIEHATPGMHLFDVGTGSGIIAITLALEVAESTITAIDLNESALALAKENAEKLGVLDRINFLESNLLEKSSEMADGIIANLPYIPAADIPHLAREVQFDPIMALDGGDDGLQLVRDLLIQAKPKLKTGGFLALELGHDQASRVADLLQSHQYTTILTLPDHQGVDRFVIATNG